jgi:hypothetical protein
MMGNMILYHGEPNGASLSALAALFESGVAAVTQHMDLPGGARHQLAQITEPLARKAFSFPSFWTKQAADTSSQQTLLRTGKC